MLPAISKDKVIFFTVAAEDGGQRLDNYLRKKLKGVPKSHIYKLIRSGGIRLNGKRSAVSTKITAADQIRIPPLRTAATPDTPRIVNRHALPPLPVIFEDDGLLIINKPAGIAVHGGSGISLGVIEQLRHERPDSRYLELVHRLDKDTSGLLMIAKKRTVLTALHRQLRENRPKKIYLGLTVKPWDDSRQEINLPLRKYTAKSGEKMVRVDNTAGSPALTYIKIKENLGEFSLLQITLATGRTHQIRVHTQSTGAPLAGDERYGDYARNRILQKLGLKRMFLHAYQLTITYPECRKQTFTAPLPPELSNFLAVLRRGGGTVNPEH